jgi:hypothetical protein
MPCDPRRAALVVLDSGKSAGSRTALFPVRGLSSQTVHAAAQRGEQPAARWRAIGKKLM